MDTTVDRCAHKIGKGRKGDQALTSSLGHQTLEISAVPRLRCGAVTHREGRGSVWGRHVDTAEMWF